MQLINFITVKIFINISIVIFWVFANLQKKSNYYSVLWEILDNYTFHNRLE